MKKKMVGIFVCALMIASVILPVTGTENIKTTLNVNENNYSKPYQNTPANFLGIITIKFEGIVTNVDDPENALGGSITVDEIITGKYTYNARTKDSDPSTERGSYLYTSSPYGIEVNAGEIVFKTDPNFVEFNIDIVNMPPGDWDGYSLASNHNLPLSDTLNVDGIYWILFNESGTAFSSDALPTTALDLSSWDDSFGFTISGSSSEPNISDFHIVIHITEVTKNKSIDDRGAASSTVRRVLIGLIKNPERIDENVYEFDPVGVFFWMNMGVNGVEIDFLTDGDGRFQISWTSKIGFIGKHFICGWFILKIDN
jgi:hypothetical protein